MKKSSKRGFSVVGSRAVPLLMLSLFVIAIVSLLLPLVDISSSPSIPALDGASAWAAENPAYKEYVEKAEEFLFAERYKEAVELLEEAINEEGHKTALLHFYLALSYDNLEELESAVENYKKAISLNIDKEELLVSLKNLGIILRAQGKNKEAARYFDRYIKLVPDDPDADNIKSYVEYYKQQ